MDTHSTAPHVRDFIVDGGIVVYNCGVYTFARLQDNNRLNRTSVNNYEVESIVCNYHVYHNIWEAVVGETLPCQRETGSPHDPYTVSVMEGSTVRAFSFRVKSSYPPR